MNEIIYNIEEDKIYDEFEDDYHESHVELSSDILISNLENLNVETYNTIYG